MYDVFEIPMGPAFPCTPTGPVAPCGPWGPCAPTNPTGPATPVAPCCPTGPWLNTTLLVPRRLTPDPELTADAIAIEATPPTTSAASAGTFKIKNRYLLFP